MHGDAGGITGIGSYLLSTMLALGLVIALAIATLWVVRRFVPPPGQGRIVNVVETIPLAPGRVLYVVAVGGRMLLLGCTEKSINLIREFQPGEIEVPEASPSPARRFVDILKGRGGSAKDPSGR